MIGIMRGRPRRWLLLALGVVCLAPNGTPPAAGGEAASALQALAAEADAIVMATCETVESRWDAERRLIVTRATLRAQRYFKGKDTGGLITVQTLGGEVDGVGMAASHAAALAVGEETVLFLRRSAYGPYHVIWGGADGKLPLNRGPGGTLLVGTAAPMDLEAFAGWVTDAGAAE